jgi:hypothetical protein
VSDKVLFRGLGSVAGAVREGWALNVSRGGLRAILDENTGKVELGEEYEITVTISGPADIPSIPRRGRIVWLQEEPDGFVVGVQYITPSGRLAAVDSAAAPPPSGQAKKSPPAPLSGALPVPVSIKKKPD